jgi:succinylglutamate desuccinylase
MLSMEKTSEGTVNISRAPFNGKMPLERLLGKYSSGRKGPALIITADAFGNEFSGILAFLNVLDSLTKLNLPLRGELTGLAGNIGSSRKGLLMGLNEKPSHYIEEGPLMDFGESQGYNEAAEFVELIEEFEKAQHAMTTGVYYMDIKTCPSLKEPYICVSRNSDCIRFAEHLPFKIIKGLEDFITDHMGFYLNAKGYCGYTLKVGPFDSYSSIEMQEAAIWLALVNCGCLDRQEVPYISFYHNILNNSIQGKKATTFEVVYKYTIQEDEFFRMVPGYHNFQKIRKGELLATSDGGPVLSHWDGLIFMPGYHTQRQDGFFVLRENI